MAKLKNDIEYGAICQRVEELLPMTDNDTPWTDRRLIELDILSELVADYEEEHFPIGAPSLVDLIELRMYEMELTQDKLSEMLNVSQSQVKDYITGKSEPTSEVFLEICEKLNIDPEIVLEYKH